MYRLEAAGESEALDEARSRLETANRTLLETWDQRMAAYQRDTFVFTVRGREVTVPIASETLSHSTVPKVAVPRFRGWGDRLAWLLQENLPGSFPFTGGIYPFKRTAEDPTRMFAGEGPAEQTNRRFHYLAQGMPAKRLSTAFDSVTLYGEDPHQRPDIYGKVGNSGVSVATLDEAKKLYSGFDLSDPTTSVSMTINGPAPIILGFFLNAAIDQACEKYITEQGLQAEVEAKLDALYPDGNRPRYQGDLPPGNDGLGLMLLGTTGDQVLPADVYQRIKDETLTRVRGTVQADILKEDQAQNTCIFSTEFSLRMMGDIQQYFVDHSVDNFYSVSISGYHMAEAGANPITQLAFTLANGFTYVEYYLSRGMRIDDFAPNLSFFFSNGIDPEYAVIGRVARRIWAKTIKHKYGGNERSQMLKYHIQTSGRSLHAQEIGFNDIRTTLQALYAIYDNTNSLHTNAYDEAVTTPTEESVRRAVAIQLIINRELGLAKNENPLQGSFIIEHLTDLVEEAVLSEFERISSRGGVLGAMERQYQRAKIQEESLYYERLKESGEYPIIGVNTFLSASGSPFVVPDHLVRSSDQDKDRLIDNVEALQTHYAEVSGPALVRSAAGRPRWTQPLRRADGDLQGGQPEPDQRGPLRSWRPIPPEYVSLGGAGQGHGQLPTGKVGSVEPLDRLVGGRAVHIDKPEAARTAVALGHDGALVDRAVAAEQLTELVGRDFPREVGDIEHLSLRGVMFARDRLLWLFHTLHRVRLLAHRNGSRRRNNWGTNLQLPLHPQNFPLLVPGDQGDNGPLGTGPTGSTGTVQVGLGILGQVDMDDRGH